MKRPYWLVLIWAIAVLAARRSTFARNANLAFGHLNYAQWLPCEVLDIKGVEG